MKYCITALVLILSLSCRQRHESGESSLTVMSFNIRLDTPSDGDNAWPYRKEMVASMIRFHRADVAGMQEVLHHQVTQLDSLLHDYDWIGTGRDDGAREGEYSPIFYNKEKLECLLNGQFWLSENPDTPGIGWDAAYPRIVTWGKFRNRHNRKTFYHFNTHFDHLGQTARKESARLIKRKIQEIAGDAPVVLTGDFNSLPSSEPYRILTDLEEDLHLTDAYLACSEPPHGPDGSWSGFHIAGEPGQRIDYIFVSAGVPILRYGILSDSWSGKFPSDHLPVLADIKFH
ncbi:MAG TPA: endonuclease/exonuclease/phosphatase family protein [Bacteroidetes bacterium]|nr:endonuclease/exonuclease/phosphatase family protein [Bacteroidota bacterium]